MATVVMLMLTRTGAERSQEDVESHMQRETVRPGSEGRRRVTL